MSRRIAGSRDRLQKSSPSSAPLARLASGEVGEVGLDRFPGERHVLGRDGAADAHRAIALEVTYR